jgi:hypothetical protein
MLGMPVSVKLPHGGPKEYPGVSSLALCCILLKAGDGFSVVFGELGVLDKQT